MRISLSFDLTPDLLNIMTSTIPALLHIRCVRVKAAAMASCMIVGFRIVIRGQPALDGSCAQADSFGNLFDLHPLLVESYHLLIAFIPLRLMSRVGLPIGGRKGQQRLFWNLGFCNTFRLRAFL